MANPVIYVYNNANCGLNPTSFVPLLIPTVCNGYLLKNAGPDTLYVRSTLTDPNTQDSWAPGFYEDLDMGLPSPLVQYRYCAGDILYYAMATGPLIGKFWY